MIFTVICKCCVYNAVCTMQWSSVIVSDCKMTAYDDKVLRWLWVNYLQTDEEPMTVCKFFFKRDFLRVHR